MGSKVLICSCFLLTLFLTLASGQILYPGSCPSNITTQDDFQVDKYLGSWWEYEKYPFFFEIGGKCIRAKYGITDDGRYVSVKNQQTSVILLNSKRSVKGTALVVGDGKLVVTFPMGIISPKSDYWVISTDYQNYAVVYSCTDVGSIFHTKVIWILTRARVPSPEIIDTAYSAIRNQQLETLHLTRTDNSNCQDGVDFFKRFNLLNI